MSTIQKVIVAGAGGNLGPSVISALHAANFSVSVLSRNNSVAEFPSFVNVIKTDYTPSSLLRSFKGQDAIVSTVGPIGVPEQIKMIDAAAEAGVKRFIPSEFGVDRTRGIQDDFKIVQGNKIKVMEHLQQKCEENKDLTWSLLATGPFIDWALLKFPAFGFVVKEKTATIYDSGNSPISCTTRASVGKAIAGLLKKPSETANKILKTCTLVTNQNELLKTLEEVTAVKWTVKHLKIADVLVSAREAMKNQQFGPAFGGMLVAQLFEDGSTRSLITTPETSDNDLLGVESEDLGAFIKGIVPIAASE